MGAKTMIGLKYVAVGFGCVVAVVLISRAICDIKGAGALVGAAVATMSCMVMFAADEGYRAGQKAKSDQGA